jgi:hypothetical protein
MRNPNCALHLAALVTKPDEIRGLNRSLDQKIDE